MGCLGSFCQNIKIFLLAAILVRWAPSFVDRFFQFFLTFQATNGGYTWNSIKEHLTLMASSSSFSSGNGCLRRMLTLPTNIFLMQPPVYREANSINYISTGCNSGPLDPIFCGQVLPVFPDISSYKQRLYMRLHSFKINLSGIDPRVWPFTL